MAAGGVKDRRAAAWFLTSAPAARASSVDRPRVAALLGALTHQHRVVMVAAPSGYGKTIAVSSWLRTVDGPAAWLTLTRLEDHPEDVNASVLAAIRKAAPRGGERLAGSWSDGVSQTHSSAGLARFLRSALAGLPEALTLVIDDVHTVASSVEDSVIPLILRGELPNLTVVIIGQDVPVPTSRLLLNGELALVTAPDLAFTTEEAHALSAENGSDVSPQRVAEVVQQTGGWPAAVRLLLLGGASSRGLVEDPSGATVLGNLVLEEVLERLEPELADFVLAATTCARLDDGLARLLTGRADSEVLLRECVRRGLFLERYVEEGQTPVYRWHGLFVDLCRTALGAVDPVRRDHLNRVAGREMARRGLAAAAVGHALRGDDPDLAAEIIRTQWLMLVLHASASQAIDLVERLPEPWASTPEVLLAHACCRQVAGDITGARLRYDRASVILSDRHESVRPVLAMQALAELFIAEDSETLSRAADQALRALTEPEEIPKAVRACIIFVVGWVKMRLRRDPQEAAQLLALAASECDRAGLGQVAARARTNLAFATAFGGDLVTARSILDRARPPREDETGWNSYDGGIEVVTRGLIAYWNHDVVAAMEHFGTTGQTAQDKGYTDLARVYLALLVAGRGDLAEVRDAERELLLLPGRELGGVPWGTYRGVCNAALLAARGEVAASLALLESVPLAADVPMMVVVAARIQTRARRFDVALSTLGLLPPSPASFVRAGALVTRATIEAAMGRTESAHSLLEAALDAAVPQGVREPFAARDDDVAELLRQHAARGTRYEQFVADCLADHVAVTTVEPLSPREREVLAYLRTPMTNTEIARALFVSANTLKTHQRSLFRKLGVTSRREAVRLGPSEVGVGARAR